MKNLTVQKRLAAQIMKCSPKKVKFDESSLEDIKEAITKQDIKSLINDGTIIVKQKKGVSRARAKKRHIQNTRGMRKGHGKRKGKGTTRTPRKKTWITRVRIQRVFLQELKARGLVSKSCFRQLYLKSKGGFFRSKRHIKLFINEQGLIQNKK